MDEQTHSKVAPDADEIGAGDEVVVLDGDGGIADSGVLCDVDGEQAEVRIGGSVQKVAFAMVAHPDSPAAEACRSKGPSGRQPEVITDPARLVKGQRYAMRDPDHPAHATSVGTFDAIRPSEWEGEEPEDYVYFTNGKIGDVSQDVFGFPVAQRREFRVV
jgi:hypothetical protein